LPSYLTQQQSGIATWYATGLGACGWTNSDTDYIAAISKDIFMVFPGYNQLDPNTNPVCNLQVSITSGGVTITVKITDECEGCDTTHLDLSPAAFDALSNNNPGLGVINIDWQFVNLPSSLR
jgi:expansin (peptidoglycan-binding protein)